MDVGNYIKTLREANGYSQEELGRMVGVQKSAVNKWEKGIVKNLKRETILKLSDIFNVNPANFIDEDSIYEDKQSNITDIESKSLYSVSNSVDHFLNQDKDKEKIKAAQVELPLSKQKKELLDAISDLSDSDLKKAIEYVEFLKMKRNS